MDIESIDQLLENAEVIYLGEGANRYVVEYKNDDHNIELARHGKDGDYYSVTVKTGNQSIKHEFALPGYYRGQLVACGNPDVQKVFNKRAGEFFKYAS